MQHTVRVIVRSLRQGTKLWGDGEAKIGRLVCARTGLLHLKLRQSRSEGACLLLSRAKPGDGAWRARRLRGSPDDAARAPCLLSEPVVCTHT